jgi:hypothetical protein
MLLSDKQEKGNFCLDKGVKGPIAMFLESGEHMN